MFHSVSNTPTVSTSPAYTANDQVGGIQTLTVPNSSLGSCALVSFNVLDLAGQSAALSLFFFNSLPTVASSDNAALNISDANMALCIGHVVVAAGDYQSTSANSIASVKLSGPLYMKSATADTLYVVVKTTGTPTYAGTTDLTFTYNFVLNN
jgi:hypothetical protein